MVIQTIIPIPPIVDTRTEEQEPDVNTRISGKLVNIYIPTSLFRRSLFVNELVHSSGLCACVWLLFSRRLSSVPLASTF